MLVHAVPPRRPRGRASGPVRPFAPRLPPELLQEILAFAVLGQEPGDQQLTRNQFRLVCRDWNESMDYWKEIAVVGSNSLGRLVSTLKVAQLGPHRRPICVPGTIDTVWIDEDTQGDEDEDELGPTTASLSGCLLELLPGLRRLSLVHDNRPDEPFDSVTGLHKLQALAQLGNLEHFTFLGQPSREGYTAPIDLTDLEMLLASWPNLRVLELVGVVLRLDTDSWHRWESSIHQPNSKLERLTLDAYSGPRTLVACLTGLPSTVTHITLDVGIFFENPLYAELLAPLMQSFEGHIAELTLLDTPRDRLDDSDDDEGDDDDDLARGGWDDALANLTKLRRLKTSPVAISNLWSTLGKLPELRELVLCQKQAGVANPVSSSEVVDYLSRQTGLEKLAVNHRIWRRWTLEGCEAVDDMADKKGVEFTYLD